MQKKSEIGSLLNKGMGSEEIKERIRDFPENPDIEYFKNLGYTEATAKNYMFKLKKNNSKQNENSKTTKKEGKKSEEFITSANPDYKNIILDTHVFGFRETSKIIDNSTQVTVIYEVINEFDRILKDENKPEILKNGIKKYRNLMLKDNSKYRLVPYKYREKKYINDIIIEYLMDLPVNERPTLLTVNKNLAQKAESLGLKFILYFKQNNSMFKLEKDNSKQNENSKTTKKEGKKRDEFITSANPDYKHIILDTCAVGFEKTSEIIDNSAKATVIYAVINEFDRILKDENKPEILKNGINTYRDLMLKDNSKYRLVPYKYRDKRYTDDIIIEYLMDLPVNERPTLLTVDKNLALKAKCLGLEFILYFKQSHNRKDVVEKQDESTNLSITAKEENENFGVKFIFRENDIQIKKHNPKAQIFWVNDGKCLEILDRNVVEKADFFVVLVKVPKWRYVKIQKVMMVNNQVVRRGYKCAYINDIYKLENEFSQEILDRAKLLLF